MNRARKEHLRECIDKLDAEEHLQILEVIKKYTQNFTKTQSGVLVSADALSNECLLEMERMVQFYMDQHKRMEADADERKQYEISQTR